MSEVMYEELLARYNSCSEDNFLDDLILSFSYEDLLIFLPDVNDLGIVKKCLVHPAISPELLESLCQLWPYDKDWLLIEAACRKSYSDELLKYLSSWKAPGLQTILLYQILNKIIVNEQISIVWKYASHQERSMLLSYTKQAGLIFPIHMWLEYYAFYNEDNVMFSSVNREAVHEFFGGVDNLRLEFVYYVSTFSCNVDVSLLPLGWLVDLFKSHISSAGQ